MAMTTTNMLMWHLSSLLMIAVDKRTDKEFVVVKGAPPVLFNYSGVDKDLFARAQAALNEKSARGCKTLAVCIGEHPETTEETWKLLGLIAILDPPRHDAALTIANLKKDENGRYEGVPPPSLEVLATVATTLTIGTLIAILWDDGIVVGSGFGMQGLGWRNGALIWAWGLMWFVIVDLLKFGVGSLFEMVQEESWEVFFTNMLLLDWNRTGKGARRQATMDQLHEDLVSVADSNISIRTSMAHSKRDSMTKFSVGLAAIAQEEDFDDANVITYEDALLAVDTLQNDPQLLRVISSMYHSIVTLQKRVEELEGKSKKD
jgi:hypothetical protein